MWSPRLVTLPTQPNAVRARVWRALKALGCAAPRDGDHVLPAGQVAMFDPQADGVRRHHGSAEGLLLQPLQRADHEPGAAAVQADSTLACAWLIRRFIDPPAQFVWLSDAARAPRGVLGFDRGGARFTHLGSRVSVEVLCTSFGLDDDALAAAAGTVFNALCAATRTTP